jgi:HD-like signal output (HDOD) protein
MAGVALVPQVKRPSSGTEAHCHRVAAIAAELGRRRGLDFSTIEALRRIALGHHTTDVPLRNSGLNRLIKDLGLPHAEPGHMVQTHVPTPLSSKVPPETKTESDMIVLANLVDESLEALPYFPMSFERILSDLRALALDGTIDAAYVEYLRPLSTAKDIAKAIDALPVFPAVALQVLAASLMKIANSGLYGASREIRTVAEAITRVGSDLAAQVLIAASMRPLFASAGLRNLWHHSIQTAAVCTELATRADGIAPGEAGVLGLVHDIGRLVIGMLPSHHAAAHTRIVEASGCHLLADYLVCGRDHAELGAEVLARLNFPVEFVEAVGFHHQPEGVDSRFAAMLYVAEYLAGSEEDIPSIARLANTLTTIGLSLLDCLDLAEVPGRFDALLNAA